MESESGPVRIVHDVIDPARANALHATLDAGGESPEAGMHLPPFWHHIYFWDCVPEQALGPDGHPRTGGLIPDTGFPHRMWAGGIVHWYSPAVIGLEAEKSSTVTRCEKQDRQVRCVCHRDAETRNPSERSQMHCRDAGPDLQGGENAETPGTGTGTHRRDPFEASPVFDRHVVPIFGGHVQRAPHSL